MLSKIDLAKNAIRKAFRDSGLSKEKLNEVVFHLTDWISDLEKFVALLEHPQNCEDAEIRRLIIALLVHAPDHLNKAAEIVVGLE